MDVFFFGFNKVGSIGEDDKGIDFFNEDSVFTKTGENAKEDGPKSNFFLMDLDIFF
jgi:hypothetical protein